MYMLSGLWSQNRSLGDSTFWQESESEVDTFCLESESGVNSFCLESESVKIGSYHIKIRHKMKFLLEKGTDKLCTLISVMIIFYGFIL